MGTPIGLLLASGIMALMSALAPGEAFYAWGWRVPFLLSIVLILVGYWVRRRVEESPVFVELADRKQWSVSAPGSAEEFRMLEQRYEASPERARALADGPPVAARTIMLARRVG